MGFLDNIKRLTQEVDSDNDMYEESTESFKTPREVEKIKNKIKAKQQAEAYTGYAGYEAPQPYEPEEEQSAEEATATGLFGNFKFKRRAREGVRATGGDGILVFAPANIDEATGLKAYIEGRVPVILKLEELPDGLERRILDFVSGMAYALDTIITPISGRTYYVAPGEVKLIDPPKSGEAENKYY